MNKPKHVAEYSDRELLEKIAVNSKAAAENSSFVKTVVIISIVLTIISLILSIF